VSGYRLSAFGSLMLDTLNKKPTADSEQPRQTRHNAMHSLDIHRPSHIAEMLPHKDCSFHHIPALSGRLAGD